MYMYMKKTQIKIQNNREPPFKLCLKKACFLFSPPSSALVMGLFSQGSPIVDIHMVKTRLGTVVPRSPESDAPRSSLYTPPDSPRILRATNLFLLPTVDSTSQEHAHNNFWCQNRLVFRVSGICTP